MLADNNNPQKGREIVQGGTRDGGRPGGGGGRKTSRSAESNISTEYLTDELQEGIYVHLRKLTTEETSLEIVYGNERGKENRIFRGQPPQSDEGVRQLWVAMTDQAPNTLGAPPTS